jgi:hypothetical protein
VPIARGAVAVSARSAVFPRAATTALSGPDGVLRAADDTFASKKEAENWLTRTEAEVLDEDWIDRDAEEVLVSELAV